MAHVRQFIEQGGFKGVQRAVLPPGTTMPIHPVAFLVVTSQGVTGKALSEQFGEAPTLKTFGLRPEELKVTVISPQIDDKGHTIDVCGIVTTLEGAALPAGAIAARFGEYADVATLEAVSTTTDSSLIETLLGNQNVRHNSYQDFQAFIEAGGCIGLQHDPLNYGSYLINPFLVKVQIAPMLVVKQGEVAVVKAYVGLPTVDTSGAAFKHGSIVRPGHRGIWQEPLRTGKYAINPRCYSVEKVPTSILNLNWAAANSAAHNLDHGLSQIAAKSREGFVFGIDLMVQIHVPDTMAPRVISMVATMANLVNEVLQGAVGNHFRDTLGSMEAVQFIGTRGSVQQSALEHISRHLAKYNVETCGVYIQDVVLPPELVKVLTEREIANQQKATYAMQTAAQEQRIQTEAATGKANMQAKLAAATVGVEIATQDAEAKKQTAAGEAAYIEQTGAAKGAEIRAVGLARAEGFREQVEALGQSATAMINIATALAEGKVKIVPEILSIGGQGGMEGLIGQLTKFLGNPTPASSTPAAAPASSPAPSTQA